MFIGSSMLIICWQFNLSPIFKVKILPPKTWSHPSVVRRKRWRFFSEQAANTMPLHSHHNTFYWTLKPLYRKTSTASAEWVTLAHLTRWLLVKLEGESRQLHSNSLQETAFKIQTTAKLFSLMLQLMHDIKNSISDTVVWSTNRHTSFWNAQTLNSTAALESWSTELDVFKKSSPYV